ncbi:MAG: hypothetical protein R2684_14250 [Pyrinomonadaceae bacterium]
MNRRLDQGQIAEKILEKTNGSFGSRIGFIGKLFGCWHKNLSRPFTNRSASYRACLECGARKKFDTRTLKTFGPYYYPPTISFDSFRTN